MIYDEIDKYNCRLSTINISPKYKFTSENSLIEAAITLKDIGINTIKFSLTPSSINVNIPSTIKTLKDVVINEPNYRYVFDLPDMKNYILWAYSINGTVIKNGMTKERLEYEYNQIYELTKYLLESYSNTDKTFYLGNWESDFGTLGIKNYDDVNPSDDRIKALIDYLNIRQKAVDDAKKDTSYNNVNVYHYAEIVMVKDTLVNPEGYNKRCINTVIPNVPDLDYLSWSAYTIEDDTEEEIIKLLDYVESFLSKNKEKSISGKRIFIGEFGWMHLKDKTETIHQANFLKTIFKWGCPFAFYWQLYGNGKSDYNLIRYDGTKTTSYYLYRDYWKYSKEELLKYYIINSKLPDDKEFSLISSNYFNNYLETCDEDNTLYIDQNNINEFEKNIIIKRNNTIKLIENNYLPISDLKLQDNSVLDLNGYNQELNTITNLGAFSIITNNSDKISLLTINNSCTFGQFAGNWFSGVKNGKGNGIIKGCIGLVINNGDITFNSKNTYIGGTRIMNGNINVKSIYALGNGDVLLHGGTLNLYNNPCENYNIIHILNNAKQVIFKDNISFSNHIIINGGEGVSGYGILDTDNNIILCGQITINGLPKNGGHFGSSLNGSMEIIGQIFSPIYPVIWRRNNGIFSGGGFYNELKILQGKIKSGNDNGICPNASLIMGDFGDVVFDMMGYNQTLSSISSKKNNVIITNNGSSDVFLTLTKSTLNFNGAIVDGTNKINLIITENSEFKVNSNTYFGIINLKGLLYANNCLIHSIILNQKSKIKSNNNLSAKNLAIILDNTCNRVFIEANILDISITTLSFICTEKLSLDKIVLFNFKKLYGKFVLESIPSNYELLYLESSIVLSKIK